MAVQCGKSVLCYPWATLGYGRCMQTLVITSRSLPRATCVIPCRRRCIFAAVSRANFTWWNRNECDWNSKNTSPAISRHLLEPVDVCLRSVTRSMAGHSKWQNIRHTKAAKDSQKSRIANKITQRIRIAIKLGGGADPKYNSALARVLEEGQRNDVPNATMEQVLKKVGKEKESGSLVIFEARGQGNCFFMIEAFTDKERHTRQSIQHILKKYGASVGSTGLASHAFELKGVVDVPSESALTDLEKATEVAIETGAEEVDLTNDSQGNTVYRFLCDPKDVHVVKQHLEEQELLVIRANQGYVAQTFTTLTPDQMELTAALLDALEDMSEINQVFDNVDPESGIAADSKTS